MTSRLLTIVCNAELDDAARELLQADIGSHRLLIGQTDCSDADVAFGQPEPRQVIESKRLQWVHITSAGYTRYDTEAVRAAMKANKTAFTNSSHVYDAPCAQHLLAMMLAEARQLLPAYASQRTDKSWPTGERRAAAYLLNEQQVLLLGMGAIARYLIRLLQPFEMHIMAVRRNAEPFEDVEVVPEPALDTVLPRADHVINTLPESPSTMNFMNAARFGQMKRGARFYNIGRGKTVDQRALMAALGTGQVGAAYLDVTEPEPLPPEHPLWTTTNCFITPHSGGGHHDEGLRLVRHFLHNLRAFESGQPLRNRVW